MTDDQRQMEVSEWWEIYNNMFGFEFEFGFEFVKINTIQSYQTFKSFIDLAARLNRLYYKRPVLM